MRVVSIQPGPSGETTIVLESEASLPRPVIGVLDDPPRIYFDFTGFRPRTTSEAGPSIGTAPDEGIVRGVRIALHTAEPPLTRVVIDLRQRTRYRLDTSAAASGKLVIAVGAFRLKAEATSVRATEATRVRARAEATSVRARAEATRVPATAGAASAPKGATTMATAQTLAGVLAQFDALRPLLTAIDRQGETSTLSLQAAAAQLESISAMLSASHPTPALRAVRDRLAQACVLAGQAVRGRLESAARGNAALNWNAASAAAGALLLLDRAREDLAVGAR